VSCFSYLQIDISFMLVCPPAQGLCINFFFFIGW
jgi:hypothetical protein